MKPLVRAAKTLRRGFTVIELMVALVVTGILASMLLKISNDVLNTYNQTTGELESHLAARFVLDQLAEDLQAAVTRRDGKVWLAATIRDKKSTRDLTKQWEDAAAFDKPIDESLRLDEELMENCRFGVGGVWLRLITQSSDVLSGQPGARAVSYLIDRRAVGTPDDSEGTSSSLATRRYTLFRGDVNASASFMAGFNLDPSDGDYTQPGDGGTRDTGQVNSPALDNGLIDNVIDFGVRFYVKDPDSDGDGYSDSFEVYHGSDPEEKDDDFSPKKPDEGKPPPPLNGLRLIFPADSSGQLSEFAELDTDHLATGLPPDDDSDDDSSSDDEGYFSTRYPDVVDVMVRVLTLEGAEVIRAFEEGDSPRSSEYDSDDEYWWHLAEQYSYVFVRRIQLYTSGL